MSQGQNEGPAGGPARPSGSPGQDGSSSDCQPCKVADREGWWAGSIPKGYTHQSCCHITHPGSQKWGHCTRCHGMFAGTYAFDDHQRVDDEGNLTDDCLCSVLLGLQRSPQEPDLEQFQVSPSVSLFRRNAEWDTYWGREALDPMVFA